MIAQCLSDGRCRRVDLRAKGNRAEPVSLRFDAWRLIDGGREVVGVDESRLGREVNVGRRYE